jgi:hypothetical protein
MFSALKVSQFDLSRNVGNGAALLPPMPKLSTLTLSPEQRDRRKNLGELRTHMPAPCAAVN